MAGRKLFQFSSYYSIYMSTDLGIYEQVYSEVRPVWTPKIYVADFLFVSTSIAYESLEALWFIPGLCFILLSFFLWLSS